MRDPAKQLRRPRTVIKWHDDGSAPRIGAVPSDGAPPYKMLGLAGVLALLSLFAVVTAIQLQRGGSLSVTSLVESAQAAPESISTLPAATTLAKPAVAEPRAKPVETAVVTQVPAMIQSTKPTVNAVPAAASPAAKSMGVAAQNTDNKAGGPTVMAAADPRWSGDAPVSRTTPIDEAGSRADEPLALVPVEMPDTSPVPEAAPRDANAAVAAIDRAAEPAPANAIETGNARVKSGVNMRARPASGAKVLVTVPRGTSLQVASNCRHWCATTYKGQSGFIYKSFLSF